jgi:hypothetical protein
LGLRDQLGLQDHLGLRDRLILRDHLGLRVQSDPAGRSDQLHLRAPGFLADRRPRLAQEVPAARLGLQHRMRSRSAR